MIVALCGGVGGAKLALGLYRTLEPGELCCVVNVADDLELSGLHVSPDLDTVMYTLAGIAGSRGWGIAEDTFEALAMLGRYGAPTWFQIGDRDLATHIVRTARLRRGERLTQVTAALARALEVRAQLLPATDDDIRTQLRTEEGWLEFQEYFVHRRYQVEVTAHRYQGMEAAQITPEVQRAVQTAEAVIIVNSNPVLSILPILALPGMREALRASGAPVVAVSPLVGEAAVSGPAGELMRLVGQPSTSVGVAGAYAGVISGLVIDREDAAQSAAIEARGVRPLVTATVMRDLADRERLARETVAFARSLR